MTAKADRVKRLLEDDDLQEAFENVRRILLEMFEGCPSSDMEQLQRISMRLDALKAVKVNLERAIEEGTLEDFRAQQREVENVH